MGRLDATKSILLVDDERNFLLSFSDLLEQTEPGWRVMPAEDGFEALAIISGEAPDLVITNINMPRMDGFELIAHLTRKHPDLPVIATSAYSNGRIREKSLELGAIAFMSKPFSQWESNVATIRMALGGEYRQQPLGLERIDLGSLLQCLNLEGETCKLTVYQDDLAGELYLEEGILVHAERAEYHGNGVAAWIISDQLACGGKILHESGFRAATDKRTVNADLHHILLKAADAVKNLAAC